MDSDSAKILQPSELMNIISSMYSMFLNLQDFLSKYQRDYEKKLAENARYLELLPIAAYDRELMSEMRFIKDQHSLMFDFLKTILSPYIFFFSGNIIDTGNCITEDNIYAIDNILKITNFEKIAESVVVKMNVFTNAPYFKNKLKEYVIHVNFVLNNVRLLTSNITDIKSSIEALKPFGIMRMGISLYNNDSIINRVSQLVAEDAMKQSKSGGMRKNSKKNTKHGKKYTRKNRKF